MTASTVAGFPVTLETALGPAVIPAPPKRVVALGLGADDLVLSLGVVPVGVGRADWGGDPDHYWPWVRAAIEARGQPLPERITVYPELDIEKIIALRPDVVLAPFSGVSPEAYAQLSRLVPVVGYPEQPFLTPVDTQIDLIAAALGTREAAAPSRPASTIRWRKPRAAIPNCPARPSPTCAPISARATSPPTLPATRASIRSAPWA
ncbi:ABC transporter substrate-binding protein [Achromobacter xylosoxidans]